MKLYVLDVYFLSSFSAGRNKSCRMMRRHPSGCIHTVHNVHTSHTYIHTYILTNSTASAMPNLPIYPPSTAPPVARPKQSHPRLLLSKDTLRPERESQTLKTPKHTIPSFLYFCINIAGVFFLRISNYDLTSSTDSHSNPPKPNQINKHGGITLPRIRQPVILRPRQDPQGSATSRWSFGASLPLEQQSQVQGGKASFSR